MITQDKMEDYIIAKKNLKMDNHWMYALSVEGREKFKKGNKEVRMQILMKLLDNGNITMPKLINIMNYGDHYILTIDLLKIQG